MPPPTDLKSISDVVLRISRHQIPVNSDVLRSVSTHFEGFFAPAPTGPVIIDPFNFKSSNFEKCMMMVHGVTLEPITDLDDIKECLLISDEFDLPHVQRMCQKYLDAIQCNDIDKYLFSVKYGLDVEKWKLSLTGKCLDDWSKEPNGNRSVNMVMFNDEDFYSVLNLKCRTPSSNLNPVPQILKMLPSEICRVAVDRSTRTGISMDAVLEIDGDEIAVNEQLLSAVSPVFREAFDTGKESGSLSEDGSDSDAHVHVTRLKIDEPFDLDALFTCMEIVHGCRDMIDKSSLEMLEQILLVTRHFELPHIEEMVADYFHTGYNLQDSFNRYGKLEIYIFACKHDLCDSVKMAIVADGVLSTDISGWWNNKVRRGQSGTMPYTLNTSDVRRLFASVRPSRY